jgi:hypothetical protein
MAAQALISDYVFRRVTRAEVWIEQVAQIFMYLLPCIYTITFETAYPFLNSP